MAGEALGDATPVDSAGPGDSVAPGKMKGCVFCAAAAHPDPLLETGRLLLIPDLYPLVPGHLLVITGRHELCMGAADEQVRAELPAVTEEAAAFLRESYGVEPLLWENGVSGQTVFHAHLHLIPVSVNEFLDELIADPGSVEINGWDEVAERYRGAGEYHYIHVHNRSWLVEGNGAMNWEGRRRLAMAAGMGRVAGKALRSRRDDDLADVAQRWRAWVAEGRPGFSPPGDA